MTFLQVWDQIDIVFDLEYLDDGFIWMVDSQYHKEDSWFGLKDMITMKGVDQKNGRNTLKRMMTIELYEPGAYNLTFIKGSIMYL